MSDKPTGPHTTYMDLSAAVPNVAVQRGKDCIEIHQHRQEIIGDCYSVHIIAPSGVFLGDREVMLALRDSINKLLGDTEGNRLSTVSNGQHYDRGYKDGIKEARSPSFLSEF